LFGTAAKSIAEARSQAAKALVAGGAKKHTVQKIETSRAPELLENSNLLAIGHCSFGQFIELVQRYYDASASGTVEQRLYLGLLAELERRGLARVGG